MTARFLRLGSMAGASAVKPTLPARKASRRAITSAVTISSAAGDQVGALLQDLSLFGCNVRGDAAWLRIGRFVSIHFADGSAVQAIVRWTRDGSIGIEFLRPLAHDHAQVIASGDNWD
jgi:PilZ domain